MKRLVVFSEFGASLRRARKFGVLERNLLIFGELMKSGFFEEVCKITYSRGDKILLNDLTEKYPQFKHLILLEPPEILDSKFGNYFYSFLAPFIHYRKISDADVFRTNQVSGAWTGLIAKFVTRKPILFRLGYPLSVRFKTEGNKIKYLIARTIEFCLVKWSDAVCVTSSDMVRYYSAYNRKRDITLLPSYVDTDAYKLKSEYSRDQPALFVGRLEPVKNLKNIILACANLDLPLSICGSGSLEQELKVYADSCGARVNFRGTVPNTQLPEIHQAHSIYLLCSRREGMPKSMIEAMASGLLCVTTPTDGGKELIEDGTRGYISRGFDAQAIQEALERAVREFDPNVGRCASEFVKARFSLKHATELEANVYKSIAASR